MHKLIEQICTSLDDGQDLVLVTISSQSGSTPRMAGASMIVHRDGRTTGTIGGGVTEAMAIREAATCFADHHGRRRLCSLAGSPADNGMLCGGDMEIVLAPIGADEANQTVFHRLLAALRSGRRAILATPLAGGGWFVLDEAGVTGRGDLPESLFTAVGETCSSVATARVIEHQGQSCLVVTCTVARVVYLVGAGHVAACTAETAARVGFCVVVMDDRAEFANQSRFPQADRIRVLPDFSDCFQGEEVDADASVVIVTRSHQSDMEVLAQALRTEAGYIGMLGSRRKRETLFARLAERGVTGAQLARVRCPIGLPIGADTPEEIAVAIVAELIQHRAGIRIACSPA